MFFSSSPIVVLRAICLPCTLRLNGWWIYSSSLPLIVICSPARKLIVVVMWQICLWILNANVSLTSRDKHKWRATIYCDTGFYDVVHQNDGLQQLLIATSAVWSTSVIANNARCTKKRTVIFFFLPLVAEPQTHNRSLSDFSKWLTKETNMVTQSPVASLGGM